MAFRAVVIASESNLHVRQGWLQVAQADGQMVAVPAEDVAVLVLENPRLTVSAAALSLLASQGMAVAVCDRRHLPAALLLPYCQHSRQTAVLRLQLAASRPLRKRLWQRLVQAKVRNQAACLRALGFHEARLLDGYAERVLSGDSSGMEAAAARVYLPRILDGEQRHGGAPADRALDYGYAVLRAAVARAVVGHGLHPPLGVHHDSQLNAFNLADDLLEVFRPWADYAVKAWALDARDAAGRAALVGLLHAGCRVDRRELTLMSAAEHLASSLVTALAEKNPARLATPEFVPPPPPEQEPQGATDASACAFRLAGEDEA